MPIVQISYCGRYIRVIVGQSSVVVPIGEWSRIIAKPTSFSYHP